MARLVLLSEGLTGKTYELKVEATTVGRVSDNAFEIAEPSISSHHCEILQRGAEVVVKDLESTNGTFINGERVTGEAVLKPGQILRLGMIEMRLESGDQGSKKKVLDHTMVIPQGVKANELTGSHPVQLENEGFEKKSNKWTRLFIVLAVAVGICLVVLLIFIVSQ